MCLYSILCEYFNVLHMHVYSSIAEMKYCCILCSHLRCLGGDIVGQSRCYSSGY